MQDRTFSVSRTTMSNSKHTTHPPPPPASLFSLPDDLVSRCLVRVPRMYYLNISWVSKDLRSLVRSPELNALRSTLPRSSLHVCFQDDGYEDNSTFHWFTLNETENGFVLNPAPFPSHPNHGSSTVAVGSKIFFIGGPRVPFSDLWTLDTRSGNMTQRPSMSVPRVGRFAAAGLINGKIYVMGGGGFDEAVKVEVFDPMSETWELAGMENVPKISRCNASMEGKVYMMEYGETCAYNPREGKGERVIRMVSQRLSEEDGSKDKFADLARQVCVVDDVLFAFFSQTELMWFDTKLNVWRKLVGRDGKELLFSRVKAMSDYDGRLVVFTYIMPTGGLWNLKKGDEFTRNVQCMLVSLDRAGEKICGRIDWSGIVATVPFGFNFKHCLAVFD